MLADTIVANRCQQLTSVVLLDDADEASPAVLTQVARLAQLDTAADARLTLVLSAQTGRLQKLGQRLLELAELRIDVEPWQPADTATFLQLALEEAGRAAPIFTDSAAARLHELAGGVPRRVKQLADLALLAGAGEQLAHVDDETIEAVFYELGVVTMSG
jgi:general secretion pathway protein A